MNTVLIVIMTIVLTWVESRHRHSGAITRSESVRTRGPNDRFQQRRARDQRPLAPGRKAA